MRLQKTGVGTRFCASVTADSQKAVPTMLAITCNVTV